MAEVSIDRLKKVPLAELLSGQQFRTIQPKVQALFLPEGSALINQDPPDEVFYFVEKGHLSGTETDPTGTRSRQREVGAGDYFGIGALVTGRPCQLTATSTEDTSLLILPLKEIHEAVLPRVRTLDLKKGDTLFKAGALAEYLYFIRRGSVKQERRVGNSDVQFVAGPGRYLGRYALLTGHPYQATVTAQEETELVCILLRDLQPLLFLHENWRAWFYQVDVAKRLRAVPLFKGFDDWGIYLVADDIQVKSLDPEKAVYRADEAPDGCYVIDQGHVVETPRRGSAAWHLAAGNFFGRESLKRPKRQSTVVAENKTRLFFLPDEPLRAFLDQYGVPLSDEKVRATLLSKLKGVPLFGSLGEEPLQRLGGYVSLVLYRSGDIIAQQGEPAQSLMILQEGEAVALRKTGQEDARVVRRFKVDPQEEAAAALPRPLGGEFFGVPALVSDELRGATVEVTAPSVWIVLARADFGRFMDEAGLAEDQLVQDTQAGAREGGATPSPADTLELSYETLRHWIVPVSKILPVAILTGLVVIWMVAVPGPGGTFGSALGIVRWLLLGILAGVGVWFYADWRNDYFRVTNEAVIHVERVLFVREQRYEAPLRQIQNVNTATSTLGQVLGYGDVDIETAAALGQVRFSRIPDPGYVQSLIQRAATEAGRGQQLELRESIRQQLEDQFDPERLKPETPASVLIQEKEEEKGERPSPLERLGKRLLWFPRFEIREEDRITWRKHWFNLVQRTGLALVVFLLTSTFFVLVLLAGLGQALDLPGLWLPPLSSLGVAFQGWIFLVMLVLWGLAAAWLKYQYEEWANDVYIVTGDQVIDQERELQVFPLWFLYTESRKQASLSNVQYVDYKIPHPLALIFNYGNVIVQTAGAEGTLDFLFVRDPRRVHDEILRRLADFQERQRRREFQDRWGQMAQWFEVYDRMSEEKRTNRRENGGPG
ncbi:MAG: cyclic nucleotide-binding domain-containing protein [Anaerolineae bacterium]|jgi:CRP-like cAMP-binding protein/membrane protein YdbS with pleckstrin-like domain